MTFVWIIVAIIFLLLTFFIGYLISRSVVEKEYKNTYGELNNLKGEIFNAKRELDDTKKEVEREVESYRKEEMIKVKEEMLGVKKEADEEVRLMKAEVSVKEERLLKREENLEARSGRLEERELKLEEQKEILITKEQTLSDLIQKEETELTRISELTKEEASEVILNRLQGELEHDKAVMIRDFEHNIERDKERISKRIMSTAISKAAADYVVDSTISVIQLPSEEMKGRIIGREGRNIRAIEAVTGVDLIIDDTPEAVVLSSFDGVRREVARITLEKLISDGRIHPTKIEEVVEKAKEEVDEKIMEAVTRRY